MKILFVWLMLVMSQSIFAQQKSDYGFMLTENWFIQSSQKINEEGEKISSQGFTTDGWHKINVPSTVLAGLVKNGVYKNIFIGENLKKISEEQFKKSWWYRNEFEIPGNHKNIKFEFLGINYKANIWLNGTLIKDTSEVFGAFCQFEFDVTKFIQHGNKNILAVEIFPPKPGDYTVGFVDWSPEPPDRNMGLWRGVNVKLAGDVSINHPFVKSKIEFPEMKKARLSISTELKNNSDKTVTGVLESNIEHIKLSKKIELEPKQTRQIIFNSDEFKELEIDNPRIWWTYNLGNPELYNLNLTFKIDNEISDSKNTKFGIREVSDYFNEYGYRGYKLNGKKILIRGGGWVDNMMLDNSYDNYKKQIEYARHMNLNTLRLEGFWGNSEELYNLCDEYGILLMAGFSCQWEWEFYCGKKDNEHGTASTPEDVKLLTHYWQDQIKWLRNHPSIFVWLYGSDKFPAPELENEYVQILNEIDSTRPYLASAGSKNSTITGKTGVKMTGPYDYVPPHYWYSDSLNGGAFGFNTEAGPGVQIPVAESIKKFIPENHLWPIDSVWYFHCGGGEFTNLNRYNEAMNNRLGTTDNLEQYCTKAQFLNYEGMRAMYESFGANKYKSTGIIQWMYNPAWPKLWWQLYDYYLIPNAAFYAARKACEPIHIFYNYGNNSIEVINNTFNQQKKLRAEIKVINFDLSVKHSAQFKFDLAADEVYQLTSLKNIKGLSKTYFIDLKLFDEQNKIISRNFYCLSTKPDVLDYSKHTWFVTPTKEYADLTDLSKLPEVELNVQSKTETTNGKQVITAEVENPSKNLALQVELNLQDEKNESLIPVTWDDNYFSIMPGEKRIIKGWLDKINQDIQLQVKGWNIRQ